MMQIEYRKGFCVISGASTSYYTMKNGVLESGVSGKMARALDRLKELLNQPAPTGGTKDAAEL